jgi:hypothetical protein
MGRWVVEEYAVVRKVCCVCVIWKQGGRERARMHCATWHPTVGPPLYTIL